MIKKQIIILLLAVLLFSCKSHPKKHRVVKKNNTTTAIISKALSYKGTTYLYGGTSKKGIDCSALIQASFRAGDIQLPRTAFEQYKSGKDVSLKKIQKGDLVFFKTGKSRKINHVGLVVSITGGVVKFIHASSSRGVMISSLKNGYWASCFVRAKRVM